MVRQVWQDLIETYDTQKDTRCICPIAHTQIIANIGVMLDESSDILAAAKIRQSIFAPCTAKSECRSSNVAPHLIHDKASYISGADGKRHNAYMDQLKRYAADTGDPFARCVLKYLEKGTICRDLENLVDLRTNPDLVITFGIKGREENTVNHSWTEYYLSRLPKNGICTITGEPDYIPDSYPGNIRFPSDMARIFCVKPDKTDGMPHMRAGYTASQKIIHTLQSFFVVWVEQEGMPLENIVIAQG